MTETLLNKKKKNRYKYKYKLYSFEMEKKTSLRERDRESGGFLTSVHIHNLDGVIITLQSLIF